MKKFGSVMLALVVMLSVPGAAQAQADAPPRVILIVGDGVGMAQWSLLRLMTEEEPAVSGLPHIGLVDTRCDCVRTTDSAAGATAYAIGQRTQYRFVGMTADSVPQRTVLEVAQQRGMATGVVTTTHVTDATPAAFYAKSPTRYDRLGIARQLADANLDVILGGGRAFFEGRPDGENLLAGMRGYTVVRTPTEFAAVDASRTSRLIGLFADSATWGLPGGVRPSLPEMARAALAVVDRNPQGFFLLLESEDTDDTFHDNLPADEAIHAVRELDAMVAEALAYQQRRPETLIVVVGDHETGGAGLQVLRDGTIRIDYTTGGHTADMVPLFAGGPGSRAFGGWLTNAEVGQLLMRAVRGDLPGD